MEEKPFWEEEERNNWWIAAVIILLIALLIAWKQFTINRKEQINAYILENLSTNTQTWNGIVIGQTTETELEERIFDLEYVQKSSINTVTSNNYSSISWSWKTSPNNVGSLVRCQDGIVDRIILSFSDELTVRSIIADYGYPDEVYVSPVGEPSEPLFWNLTLYYLEEGINIGANSRKLKKTFSHSDEVEFIELFAPEHISSAHDLAFVYGIDIRDIVKILPAWVPTKDKQLFEAYLALFRHTDKIPYGPEGIFETSGIELGMSIANNEVKILRDGTTYDSDGILIECPSTSKSCTNRTSADPNRNNHIFIKGLQAASINFHAGIIAHEAFHLFLPFDTMQNSLYEEMTAIAIGYFVSDGKNSERYIATPPPDLTTAYSEVDIAGYIVTYCGESCSYLNLPTYPDTWNQIKE